MVPQRWPRLPPGRADCSGETLTVVCRHAPHLDVGAGEPRVDTRNSRRRTYAALPPARRGAPARAAGMASRRLMRSAVLLSLVLGLVACEAASQAGEAPLGGGVLGSSGRPGAS